MAQGSQLLQEMKLTTLSWALGLAFEQKERGGFGWSEWAITF